MQKMTQRQAFIQQCKNELNTISSRSGGGKHDDNLVPPFCGENSNSNNQMDHQQI